MHWTRIIFPMNERVKYTNTLLSCFSLFLIRSHFDSYQSKAFWTSNSIRYQSIDFFFWKNTGWFIIQNDCDLFHRPQILSTSFWVNWNYHGMCQMIYFGRNVHWLRLAMHHPLIPFLLPLAWISFFGVNKTRIPTAIIFCKSIHYWAVVQIKKNWLHFDQIFVLRCT